MKFYRYHDYHSDRKCTVHLEAFELIKETKCGYWIKAFIGKKRWVSKTSKKRYAYPTKKEAAYNFLRRKQMQRIYAERNMDRVKKAEHMAMKLVEETNPSFKIHKIPIRLAGPLI